MRQHITIKDIARIAGVSTSTVSRALSNSPELSEQTRGSWKSADGRATVSMHSHAV